MVGSIGLEAQAGTDTGRVLGRVLEKTTGEPVSQAEVTVVGGPSTLSDLNGRFMLSSVAAGTVDIRVQALGYASKTVTDVEVVAGELATVDITMESQALDVGEVRVSAVRERGSTTYLLDERRTSEAMVEAVGSEEISRRPDSDAADVAQRLTGVTVSEGKYVFVRGLGERYSQTTLNGSSLPSPEPEREVVPLDLFPSGFLQSLQTQKSYTPDLAADFSGAAVQIRTRDFPSRFAGKFGVSTSFNTNSQFRDDFLHYSRGGTDWLGIDDGTRDYPERVTYWMGGILSGARLPSEPERRAEVAEALRGMDRQFRPLRGSTPLNRSFNFSIGAREDIGERGELGYFLAGTYSDSYTVRADETEKKWRAGAFQEGTAEMSDPNVDYAFERGERSVSWGTIANLAWKPSPDHQLAFKSTVNLNTDDEARRYEGVAQEDIDGMMYAQRARFLERLMAWGQLSGEHQLFLDSRLEWRVTGARATRDEPLTRETIYVYDENRDDYFLLDFTESARYFSSTLTDDDMSGQLDWRIPFPFFDRAGHVKLGGAYRLRDREFGARRLNWLFLGSEYNDLDAALDTATVVQSGPLGDGDFAISEVVEPGDLYSVDDRRTASYAMIELPVTDRLQVVGGARVETYDLDLVSRDSTLQDLHRTDVAPAVNVVYGLSDEIKIRGAWSRTLDRPEFRELAPFQFTEATSLRQLKGNPNLVPAEITSFDLRADWFFAPNQLLSLGGFYKDMKNPIEQVFIAAASSAYSFQNAIEATVWGLEFDAQMGLGRVTDALDNFGLQANYSRIFSEVNVREEGIFQPTNLERPLEGQAPYVVNAGLTYADGDLDAGVYYNRFGARLTAAGGSGLPDIYEQPRNSVDASVSFPIRSNLRAKVKGTNLLDERHQFLQSANGYTKVQREYTVGRTFSVGITWEF